MWWSSAGRPDVPAARARRARRVCHAVAGATGTDRLLTSAQVLARLGISRQVANWIMLTPEFSGVVQSGTVTVVNASAPEDWLLAL